MDRWVAMRNVLLYDCYDTGRYAVPKMLLVSSCQCLLRRAAASRPEAPHHDRSATTQPSTVNLSRPSFCAGQAAAAGSSIVHLLFFANAWPSWGTKTQQHIRHIHTQRIRAARPCPSSDPFGTQLACQCRRHSPPSPTPVLPRALTLSQNQRSPPSFSTRKNKQPTNLERQCCTRRWTNQQGASSQGIRDRHIAALPSTHHSAVRTPPP